MYELDGGFEGFRWINADDTEKSIYSFYRQDHTGRNNLMFVINFTPMDRGDYRVGVPRPGKYTLMLNSDEAKYGGNGAEIAQTIKSEPIPWDGQEQSIGFRLAPFAAAIFKF
jgi:1,4-alpha-glucan branching enzyme